MIMENDLGAVIVNSFGDQYFHNVNGSAFNKVGSAALYRQHFGEKLQEENSLYIILGTDSGLLPKYLQNSGIPEGTRYIFVELPEILSQLEPLLPEDGLGSRIILTTPDEWAERAVEIEFQNYVYLSRMEFCRSVGAEDLHIEEYQEKGRQLQEQLEKIRWMLQAEMGSSLFNLRQLENLPENRLSANCLAGTFSGRSAIILGGGPSLDSAIPWVIEQRNNLVVIAVSRICRRLLEIGLVPDIILSIDPNQISFDISKEMLSFWERTIFVHQHHVSHKLLGQWRGRSFFLGPRFDWPTSWNDESLAARGPTVTNCAIDLAVQMGFSRIFLTGVDLCFSKHGFTHAQGSNEQKAGPQLGLGQLWVETNDGEMAETTPDLHFAINAISEQARVAREKNSQLCNLSADAAMIEGVEFRKLDAVKLESFPQSAFELLQEVMPEDNSPVRSEYLQDMLIELQRAFTTFKEIKAYAEEGLKANDSFFGRRGKTKGHPKYKKKLDRIEKKLQSGYPDFTRLIKRVGIRNFLKMTHGEQDHQQWDDSDVERLGRVYYESYRDSAKCLLEMVKTARERVQSRLEEEQVCPDFNLLIKQWDKDEQPGRALVWKTRHGEKNIPQEYSAEFERLEKDFADVLADTETMHMARAKAWSQLGPVCGKLKLMYRRAEQESLEHLCESLETIDEQEANALYHLGSGFLAELNKDVDAALGQYQLVIDLLLEEQEGAALEEALLRVFAISLDRQDVENALLSSNCLAGFSPAYLQYYADMLRLAGDKVSALDVYADYLAKVKGDISVMLKMGRLYLELEVEDGARLMFEMVLEQEPANQAAKHLLAGMQEGAS